MLAFYALSQKVDGLDVGVKVALLSELKVTERAAIWTVTSMESLVLYELGK